MMVVVLVHNKKIEIKGVVRRSDKEVRYGDRKEGVLCPSYIMLDE